MIKELSQFDMEKTTNRKTSLVEEFLDIDESLIELEKNSDLIRVEMNIIEFPLFSRSRKIKTDQVKKYYFASDKSSFLEVVPGLNKTIPGEFEERVFIALLKIFKNKSYSQTFYCTASEILDNLNIDNYNTRASFYSRIRDAISKLASTNYKFKNLFYSNEKGGTIGETIETSVLSYHRVTSKDSTKEEKGYFNDKRIKEVYKISLANYFYENIVRKGYLAFDSDELLSIKDSVTRSIYTMITKWRNNNLYLKRPAFYIARRIPLSWKPETVRKTVPRIEQSLIELKTSGYITDYNLLKNGKLDKAEFEIFFSDEHNKIKREIFYDEKADFNKMVHYEEERQNTANSSILKEQDDYTPNIKEILFIFGEKGCKLKTLPQIIKEALKNYDFTFVKYTAEYTVLNCKVSYIKYFKDALEKRWADEFIAKKESFAEKRAKKEEKIIEEAVLVDELREELPKHTWEEFLYLDTALQDEIEAATYKEFLMVAGSNDNKTMRSIFEKSKKSLILKVMDTYEFQKSTLQVEIIETKEEVKVAKSDIENNEQEYASFSHFILAVTDFVEKNNILIDLVKVIQVFKLLGEYEDFGIKFTYNETTKIGKIIKK